MRTIVLLATIVISVVGISTTNSEAQVACFDYGSTLSCDGPRGNTSITELSRGQGIIQTDRETIPYTIIGRDRDEPRPLGIQPLEPIDRLPSLRDERPSTFEERQAIRESGRIPW